MAYSQALDDVIAGKITFEEAAEICDVFHKCLTDMKEKIPPRRDSIAEV